jgi:uncharacterized protein YbjT (DUF2867 family)
LRVLVLGGTGLIGSAVSARLRGEGHEVTGLARSAPPTELHHDRFIEADISKLTDEKLWHRHLEGQEAVVNCAGVLQDSLSDSASGVHARGPAALFKACERLGIRRVIHLSAIGVERGALSEFSGTKLAGDEALTALDLDWVILRPSVVLGRAAFGGSALFRGLAGLPVLPVPSDTGPLQVVRLEDLVETIVLFLREEAPSRVALDVAGPERLSFSEVVGAYRRWLGFGKPKLIRLPSWMAALMYRLGDLVGLFGWKTPIRTNARREIVRGAAGDNTAWIGLTGRHPQSLEQALAAEPASVQEKWFARLYLLKALVIGVFALFWISTGLISLGPGWGVGMELMREGGVAKFGPLLITAGATADILIGLGIAFRRTARHALFAALGLSIVYVIVGTLLVPRLWADPLGPMLKIWPVMALNLVAIAILDDR